MNQAPRILRNQHGFMTLGAHLIGVVLLGAALGLLAVFLDRWLESRLAFWLVMFASVVPLFVLTHAAADFIARRTGW